MNGSKRGMAVIKVLRCTARVFLFRFDTSSLKRGHTPPQKKGTWRLCETPGSAVPIFHCSHAGKMLNQQLVCSGSKIVFGVMVAPINVNPTARQENLACVTKWGLLTNCFGPPQADFILLDCEGRISKSKQVLIPSVCSTLGSGKRDDLLSGDWLTFRFRKGGP